MKSTFMKFSWVLILLVSIHPLFAQETQTQEATEDTQSGDDTQTAKDAQAAEETQAGEKTESAEDTEVADDTLAFIDVNASVWLTDIMEDSSKAEEYGQLPQGFVINSFSANVLMKDGRFLNLNGERVRLNNAHYGFDYGMSGKYVLRIDYSKIPHQFSKAGETIWDETSPGVWSIADNIQQTVQSLNNVPTSDPTYNTGLFNQRTYVSNLLSVSHPQSLEIMRDRGNVNLEHFLNADWKLGVNYFQENRNGNRPFGTTFGFSWATEVPEHLIYRTYDIHAAAEYNKNGKSFTFGYDLSLFENEIQAMIWDNPLRFEDRIVTGSNGDGTSRGRLQLAPDNTANTFSAGAATKLGRGRLTGSFAFSLWTDNVDLLPFTINSAIEPIPLPSSTFKGKQEITNATIRYTTPVGSRGDLTANYRLYDNNNKNDQFVIGQTVRTDQNVEALERTECDPATNTCVTIENPLTPLFAFSTNTLDFNFGYKLTKNLKWYASYAYDRMNREERDTDTTNTNRFKTGIDAFAAKWLTLHLSYQYLQRRSDDFHIDNEVYLFAPLRRYDVANLNQNAVRAVADIQLSEAAILGANFLLSNNNYPDSQYGVLKWNHYSIGADFSYAFKSGSNFNLWYEHANTDRDQRARQSNSDGTPATSPTRDWFVSLVDRYDTVGAGYTRGFHNNKVNWNIGLMYAVGDGRADFDAGPELRPTGAVNLPNVDDTDLFSARTGIDIKVFPRARIGFFYWYERYTIDDFAENNLQEDLIFIPIPGQSPAVGGTITLNEIQPDYEFNSGWVGFIYNW